MNWKMPSQNLKTLKKFMGGQQMQQESPIQAIVKELQQTLQNKEFRKRFLVKHLQKLVSIDVSNISYFYSDERLSFFKTADDKKYMTYYTIDEIENMVDP